MPRSFLIKKKAQKSLANAASELKPKGQAHDLGVDSLPESTGLVATEPVQEISKLHEKNDLEKSHVYPAEVTANYLHRLKANSDQSQRDPMADVGVDDQGESESHNVTAKCTSRRVRVRQKCSDCQRSFSTVSGLHKHKQFHCASPQSRKEFTCKSCNKTYVSLGALKMHIRTHTLPCQCQYCGKAFSRPWLLQGHIRTHTGEKPYQCSSCQRAFADRSNLRAHLQTHSSVKKYSCSQCSRSFSRMSLLTKHRYSCGDGNEHNQ